jgi:hypothetical protein
MGRRGLVEQHEAPLPVQTSLRPLAISTRREALLSGGPR